MSNDSNKDYESLVDEFHRAYNAWVATRPLIDDLEEHGYISSSSLRIRNHAWNRYVVARDDLQASWEGERVKH